MTISSDASGWKWVPVEPTEEMLAALSGFVGCECGNPVVDYNVSRDDYRAMLAASPQAPSLWMPIDTAPKDGTLIDVWIGCREFPRRITDVSWREPTDSEWWVHGGDLIESPDATWHDSFGPLGKDEQPTHWQPLPTPPEAQP